MAKDGSNDCLKLLKGGSRSLCLHLAIIKEITRVLRVFIAIVNIDSGAALRFSGASFKSTFGNTACF